MKKIEIISSLENLGNMLGKIIESDELISKTQIENQWFVPDFTLQTLKYWSEKLTIKELDLFTESYFFSDKPLNVGIVTAGNIPLVGFHDLLCVLLSGNNAIIKISSSDSVLMNFVINRLIEINSKFKNRIIVSDKLNDCDAYIATGSNNTSRYFEYYFSNKPNIIRKNRNSLAILTGNENDRDLQNLSDDVFNFFGLGCRNVSKIFVPKNYNFDRLFRNFEKYRFIENHNKFINNYTYHKAIFLMNNTKHFDNGFILLKEDQKIQSPLSVLYYSYYDNVIEVDKYIESSFDDIQIVLAAENRNKNYIRFGNSQIPELYDYADNIDTMKFLNNTNTLK